MRIHPDALQLAAAAALLAEVPAQQVEIDSASTALAVNDAADEVADISRNVEDVSVATATMESYARTFFASVPSGEWNQRVARQYQLGMGAILGTLGYSLESSEYSAPYGDIGVTQSGPENLAATQEKSAALIGNMVGLLKSALTTFINTVSEYIQSTQKAAQLIDQLGVSLQGQLSSNVGEAAADEFDGFPSWARYLYQGDTLLSSAAAMQTACDLGQGLVADWAQAYRGAYTLTDNDDDGISGLHDHSLPDLNGVYFGDWPDRRTVVLSGDTFATASIQVVDSAALVTLNPKVLTPDEIGGVVRGLSQLAQAVRGVADQLTQYQDLYQQAVDSISADADITLDVSLLSRLLSKSIEPIRFVPGYLLDVARDAYTHATCSLDIYQ